MFFFFNIYFTTNITTEDYIAIAQHIHITFGSWPLELYNDWKSFVIIGLFWPAGVQTERYGWVLACLFNYLKQSKK